MKRIIEIKSALSKRTTEATFRTASTLSRSVAAAAAFLFILNVPGFAQTNINSGAVSPAPVNISGYWELRYDSRNVPIPALTAKAAAVTQATKNKNRLHDIRWCILLGMPFIMDSGAPIDIQQDTKFIGILAEPVSGPRTIYIDGRPHPPAEIFDATTNGHTIGHWEGDTLVVDTVGFSDKGITDIPGGGIRTPTSHLVERYRLTNGGTRLLVTFTWTDPKTFLKPYTYAFSYYRAAPGYRPRDYDCNAGDKDRADFLEGTPHE